MSRSSKPNLGELYQVYSEVTDAGKTVKGSKKKIRWLIGFSEREGEIEIACIHSVVSGKKTVFEDGREITSSTNMMAAEFGHTWRSETCPGRLFRVEFSTSMTTDPTIYTFMVDGIKFIDMPKKGSIGGGGDHRKGSYSTTTDSQPRTINGFGGGAPSTARQSTGNAGRASGTAGTGGFGTTGATKEDYLFGTTHDQATIHSGELSKPPAPTPSRFPVKVPVPLHPRSAIGALAVSEAWSADISHRALAFTNASATVKLPAVKDGHCFSYVNPTAFARLSGEHSKIIVRLDASRLDRNWDFWTFGLATTRKKVVMGPSWGLTGGMKLPTAVANKTVVSSLPRKVKDGDVLTGEVNVAEGWFDVRLNQSEFMHRFTIPIATKEGYLFGLTFSHGNHQATILKSGASEVPVFAPSPPPVPKPDPKDQPPVISDEEFPDPVHADWSDLDPVFPLPAPTSEEEDNANDPVLPAAEEEFSDPVLPITPSENFTRGAPAVHPCVAVFATRHSILAQQALHVSARQDWMARRDDLQRQYKEAKEARPKDYDRIATLGLSISELNAESTLLLLTEEDCAALPARRAALLAEIEAQCDQLEEQGDFLSLKSLAAQLTQLNALIL